MDNKPRQRYISLQASISLGMVALGILISAIVGAFYYYDLSNQARADIKLRLRNITDMVALQLDPQELSTVSNEQDVNNEFYIKYQRELSEIIKSNPDLIYIYTMRKDSKGTIYFYLDTGDENYVPDPPGVIPYEQPSDLLLATFASPSGTVVENDLYSDEYGTFISAYKPIFNQDGSLESVLGVDIRADAIRAVERNTIRKIWIYAGISLPLVILLSWILGYRLSRPSVALATVATRIAQITEHNPEPIPSSAAGNSKEAFELIQVFNRISGELHNLIQSLEQRVAERTADISNANQKNERRAKQFAAIGQIARAIASFEELDTLLPRVTQLVSQQFGFYHVGIFLNDDANQYAILSAANSEGGKRMLRRGHRLRIGAEGIVGYVIGTGYPRVALDTGVDTIFFNNPDLPETRSELALPLVIGGKVIGALDVQSTEPNAFGLEDTEVLSTLADQIAIAIQNARSFIETKRLLNESRSVLSEYITESWKVFRRPGLTSGYRKAGADMKPLQKELDGDHIHEAVEQSKTVATSTQLAIPIRLRGEVIGVMSLNVPEGRQWRASEISIAEAVAERLSLAVETATLIRATQHRANIERITADITGRISTSSHLETILQTAAQELNRALGGSDVLVQIEPISMKLSSSG